MLSLTLCACAAKWRGGGRQLQLAGSYFEANTWDANHFNRYAYFQNKRVYYAWKELNEVRAKYGLPPLAQPDGWIDGTSSPKKQNHWAE